MHRTSLKLEIQAALCTQDPRSFAALFPPSLPLLALSTFFAPRVVSLLVLQSRERLTELLIDPFSHFLVIATSTGVRHTLSHPNCFLWLWPLLIVHRYWHCLVQFISYPLLSTVNILPGKVVSPSFPLHRTTDTLFVYKTPISSSTWSIVPYGPRKRAGGPAYQMQ